jgi:hypothetical protein
MTVGVDGIMKRGQNRELLYRVCFVQFAVVLLGCKSLRR